MGLRRLLVVLLALAPAVGLLGIERPSSAQPPGAAKKYALLVGCSKYTGNAGFSDLDGGPNDARLLEGLLVEQFHFDPADIVRLTGWPDDPAKRPTKANIVKAAEDLIRKADSNTQIVILLAGHGTQVPIPEGQDPFDKNNYEPDGLDEAFVPADAGRGGPRGWHNLLLDDQIGEWLDAFRQKGAAVWIIFDCCHSGSMDRGGADLPGAKDEVRVREVNAVAAGLVAEKAWQQAVDRAADRVAKAKADGQWPENQLLPELSPLGKLPVAKGKGSVVAFYASQAFETEKEHYPNAQVPRTPDNIFGRLTWNLVQTARQFQGKFKTYGELAVLLKARYAATFGSASPTPYCDGDLQRAVLGSEVVKQTPITLKKGNDLRVSAGALQGLTVGSVLAVYPAIGSGGGSAPGDLLGYVQVVSVAPLHAVVQPTAFEGNAAVPVERLPNLARCELKSRDVGDLKVRVAVPLLSSDAANQLLEQIRKGLSKETQDLVQFVDHTCDADWILWIHENRVQLRQGEGRPLPETLLNAPPVSRMQRVFFVTKLQGQPLAEVVADVERDLQRVFTAHNLLRVASTATYETTFEGIPALQFTVLELSKDGKTATPLPEGSQLFPGQRIGLEIANNSPNPWWVVLCVLGSDFEIRVFPTTLQGTSKWNLKSATISGASWGKEVFVVLGGPLKVDGVPDFSFLVQEGLYPETEQRSHGSKEKRNTDKIATTPFGKLLARVAGNGQARSLPVSAPSNPVVRYWSGISLPPADRVRRPLVGKKG
jgi:hypothetical protein